MDVSPPDAEVCQAPIRVSESVAAEVLATLRGKLPRTAILSAKAAPICGLIELQLENGNVAYTDKSGRYLIMGLMVDTITGQFSSHRSPSQATQEPSE